MVLPKKAANKLEGPPVATMMLTLLVAQWW